MRKISRRLWAAMRIHEHNQKRRSFPQPPPGQVFLTDIDGSILTDVDGSYLTEKE
jgi:hypothetical protein